MAGELKMDVRKKLVELFYDNNVRCDQKIEGLADDVMDIIAHGVTLPQWISVDNRLPEPFVSVLVHMPGEEPCPTVHEGFISNDGIWQSAMFRREPGEVTHWQPMPQPPKGE